MAYWWSRRTRLSGRSENVDRADVGHILPLAFLRPKMLDDILTGSQRASLTPRHFARTELPLGWTEQDLVLQ